MLIQAKKDARVALRCCQKASQCVTKKQGTKSPIKPKTRKCDLPLASFHAIQTFPINISFLSQIEGDLFVEKKKKLISISTHSLGVKRLDFLGANKARDFKICECEYRIRSKDLHTTLFFPFFLFFVFCFFVCYRSFCYEFFLEFRICNNEYERLITLYLRD